MVGKNLRVTLSSSVSRNLVLAVRCLFSMMIIASLFSASFIGSVSAQAISVSDTDINIQGSVTPAGSMNGMSVSGVTISNSSKPFAYVSGYYDHNIYVIDYITGTVIDTISVGSDTFCIAFHPSGEFAYVTTDRNILVIRTSDHSIVKDIPTSYQGRMIAFNPGGEYAYVTSYFFTGDYSDIISTSDHSIAARTDIKLYSSGVAFHPSGEYAYITDWNNDSVYIIQTSDHSTIGCIPGMSDPYNVAFSKTGNVAYVTNYNIGMVSVIDTSTSSVIHNITIPGCNGTNGLAVDPSGNFIYVTDKSMGYGLWVIDTSDYSIAKNLTVCQSPRNLAIDPSGKVAYVPSSMNSSMFVIDTSSHSVVDSVYLGSGGSWHVAFNPAGDYYPPEISSTYPSKGAANVGITSVIKATFNEPIDTSIINGSTLTVVDDNGSVVTGNVTCSGADVIFTPTKHLNYTTTYTATITGVKDLLGFEFEGKYSWSFSTGQYYPHVSVKCPPSSGISYIFENGELVDTLTNSTASPTPSPVPTPAPTAQPTIEATATPVPTMIPSSTPVATPPVQPSDIDNDGGIWMWILLFGVAISAISAYFLLFRKK
ncbi:Ig-like domain-containing protein [Methanooceanicella nereidis]|nr:Ig-like domain-containing protein [Methanocella sp. CWC-04]